MTEFTAETDPVQKYLERVETIFDHNHDVIDEIADRHIADARASSERLIADSNSAAQEIIDEHLSRQRVVLVGNFLFEVPGMEIGLSYTLYDGPARLDGNYIGIDSEVDDQPAEVKVSIFY